MRAFTQMNYSNIISHASKRLGEIADVRKRGNLERAYNVWWWRQFWSHPIRTCLGLCWIDLMPSGADLDAIISERGFDACEWHGCKEDRLNEIIKVAERGDIQNSIYLDDEYVLLLTTPIK